MLPFQLLAHFHLHCTLTNILRCFACYDFAKDVGRSCILVTIGGKNIMLDCGMHMGFNDSVSSPICSFTPYVEIYCLDDIQ